MTQSEIGNYRIGEWVLIPSRNLITSSQVEVTLEPRAAELLTFLAQRQNEVISLDDLLNGLWAGRVVTDSSVYRLVAELRRILGDDARSPRYIETVRKRGYRLLATVEPLENSAYTSEEGINTSALAPTAKTDRARSWWRLAVPAAGLVLLATFAGLSFWRSDASDYDKMSLVGTTLAVLPFETLTPETPDYLSPGVSRILSDRLAAIDGVQVVAFPSVLDAMAEDVHLVELAKRLNVDHLLVGTLTSDKSVRSLQVTVALMNPHDGRQLWTTTVNATVDDILTLQDALMSELLRQFDMNLVAEGRSIAFEASLDAETWQLYLEARALLDQGYQRQNLIASIERFDQVIQRSPGFTSALAERAVVHLLLYSNYHDRTAERLARAADDISRMKSIKNADSDVYFARGYYLMMTGEAWAARTEFKQALARRPSSAPVLLALGQVESRLGNMEPALDLLLRAVKIAPRNARYHYELGMRQMAAREFRGAEASFSTVLSLDPGFVETHLYRAYVFLLWTADTVAANRELRLAEGKMGESKFFETLLSPGLWGFLTHFDTAYEQRLIAWGEREAAGDPATWHFALAELSLRRGDETAAATHYERAVRLREYDVAENPTSPWLVAELGIAYAGLGRRADALAAIDRALALAPPAVDSWHNADFLWIKAKIMAMLGDTEGVVFTLREALRYPGQVTPAILSLEPHWRPLFDEQDFLSLISDDGLSWRRETLEWQP